jgi:uncharacterized membrane protein YphA (DoxX/SURF4 family)
MMKIHIPRVWHALRGELRREGALLLPLRLFIGLGWLRAGVEKLVDPAWHTGAALSRFLQGQMASDAIPFPWYQALVEGLFQSQVLPLSWLIMLGQMAAGGAILTGACTNLALVGGLFMNVNFVLAGRVNPSAFYIVIQTALFVANTGAIAGIDVWLSSRLVPGLVTAHRRPSRTAHSNHAFYRLVAVGSWIFALSVLPFIRDFSAHSVDDPAMLLVILATLGGISAFIVAVQMSEQSKSNEVCAPSHRALSWGGENDHNAPKIPGPDHPCADRAVGSYGRRILPRPTRHTGSIATRLVWRQSAVAGQKGNGPSGVGGAQFGSAPTVRECDP